MSFSHCNYKPSLLFLFLLSTGSAIHPHSEENFGQEDLTVQNTTQETQQQDIDQKTLDKLIAETESFINEVSCMFGDLACLVKEDAIPTKNKAIKTALIGEIAKTSEILRTILRQVQYSPTVASMDSAINITRCILRDCAIALRDGFTTYKCANPEDLVKRSAKTPTSNVKELSSTITRAKKYSKKMQQAAENAGLTIGNRIYRNIVDNPATRFGAKYNLHWGALYTTAVLACASYAWFKIKTSPNGCNAEDLGYAPGTDVSRNKSYNADSSWLMTQLGKLHDTINKHIRSWLGWPDRSEYQQYERQMREIAQERLGHTLSDCVKNDELKTDAAENVLKKFLEGTVERPLPYRVNIFGDVDREATRMVHNYWTLGATLFYEPFRKGLSNFYDSSTKAVSKYLYGLHAWAKGGIYYQKHKQKKDDGDFEITPKITLDDLIGGAHLKHVFQQIIDYFTNPEYFERAGIAPKTGFLLEGKTRTGKTLSVEGLVGTINSNPNLKNKVRFFSIKPHHIASRGEFSFLMDMAKYYAPCIIFIDEIDMLNLHKKFEGNKTMLGEVLTELSGCLGNTDPEKKVIIIAATNNKNDLGASILERFPNHIPFEYPSYMNRAEYIVYQLKSRGLPLDEFNIKKLVELTESCSYEKIGNIINDAQFNSRNAKKPVNQLDIERCIYEAYHKIIFEDDKTISDSELEILSAHMIGHTLAYKLLEGKNKQLAAVTIRPHKTKVEMADTAEVKKNLINDHQADTCIKFGKIITYIDGDSLEFTGKKEYKRYCMIALAGHIAQEILLGEQYISTSDCSEHDVAEAFNWAKKYVLNGTDERAMNRSETMRDKIVNEAYAFMEGCKQELRTLFTEHKALMTFLADFIKTVQIFDKDALDQLIAAQKEYGVTSFKEYLTKMEELFNAAK